MTIEEIKSHLLQNFENIHLVKAEDDLFFMHGDNEKLPFATLITRDNDYDSVSNLDREGFFRFNFCVDKEVFRSMFKALNNEKKLGAYMQSGIDFTIEDTILPHPTYGSMNWVCVVKPSKKTFETIKTHLESSYKSLKTSKQ